MKSSCVLVCFVLLAVDRGSAETFVVDELGNGNFTSVQAAVNWALAGDTIEIRPGTYGGFTLSKTLRVTGAGPRQTQIYGEVRVENHDCTLLDLGVTNPRGVGIRIVNNYNVWIQNCLVYNCGSHGIYWVQDLSRHVTVINCTLASNRSWGIYFSDNAHSLSGSATVEGCLFANNGMGMYLNVLTETYGHNLFFGHDDGAHFSGISRAAGFITDEDPLFIDAGAGNFALQAGSPARDAGSPGAATLDPDGTRNDMGCFGGPRAAKFWPYVTGGPVVRKLRATPTSVPQGGTIRIEAEARVNDE